MTRNSGEADNFRSTEMARLPTLRVLHRGTGFSAHQRCFSRMTCATYSKAHGHCQFQARLEGDWCIGNCQKLQGTGDPKSVALDS